MPQIHNLFKFNNRNNRKSLERKKDVKWFKINNKNTRMTSKDTRMFVFLMQGVYIVGFAWYHSCLSSVFV